MDFVFTACDQKCDPLAGCDVHGAGKCDGNCTQGYGIGSDYYCARKYLSSMISLSF